MNLSRCASRKQNTSENPDRGLEMETKWRYPGRAFSYDPYVFLDECEKYKEDRPLYSIILSYQLQRKDLDDVDKQH